jgi:hypothetical protein
MKLTAIKPGKWYQTKVGVGRVVTDDPRKFSGVVKMDIVAPFPRGRVLVPPRDVLRELEDHEIPPELRDSEV